MFCGLPTADTLSRPPENDGEEFANENDFVVGWLGGLAVADKGGLLTTFALDAEPCAAGDEDDDVVAVLESGVGVGAGLCNDAFVGTGVVVFD